MHSIVLTFLESEKASGILLDYLYYRRNLVRLLYLWCSTLQRADPDKTDTTEAMYWRYIYLGCGMRMRVLGRNWLLVVKSSETGKDLHILHPCS
jgi:hypothetical protein